MGSNVPDDLIRRAMLDPAIRGRVFWCDVREPLLLDGACVGFVTPHLTASGWRAGPIYVSPEARGRGLLVAYYAGRTDRDWAAFVPEVAVASLHAHLRAGFLFWRRSRWAGVWLRRGRLT